jgi:hypothetical protein
MQLPPADVERFYAIWRQLILFVNDRLRLVPALLSARHEGAWDVQEVKKVRDALWADDSWREAFLAEGAVGLAEEDRAIVRSWQHRRAGRFVVLRHLKQYSVFLDGEGTTVYGVLGLVSPLDEIVPFGPCYVEAVLLPFEGRIIYDSLIAPFNITFGRGIRTGFEQSYRDAKERGAIVTSLGPPVALEHDEELGEARSANSKVLVAFRKHLYRAGLSPKVVERDLVNVTAFAEDYLLVLPRPRSFRDCDSEDVGAYLGRLEATLASEARRREARTSLKRFVRFLRDTDRMDYHEAEDALRLLRRSG